MSPVSAISAKGKSRVLLALRRDERHEARNRIAASGGHCDSEFRDLVFGRLQPAAVGGALFEQAVAVAQCPLERVDARPVVGIDREDQAVEKPPPLAGRPGEELVHPRRLPDEAQVIGKRPGRGCGGAIDAEAAGLRLPAIRRLEARAELHAPAATFDLDRYGETAAAANPRAFGELGAAQAAAGRKQRQGFEHVGLAGAVLAGQHDHVRVERKIERRIGAEIGKDQPPHRRRGEILRARRDGAGFGMHRRRVCHESRERDSRR